MAPGSPRRATTARSGVWDPVAGVARHVLAGHTAWVRALAAPADGRWLASAGYDGAVRVWEPASGELRHLLAGHTDIIRMLAAPDSGAWLASAGDDATLRVWDPRGERRHVHTLAGPTSGPVVSP